MNGLGIKSQGRQEVKHLSRLAQGPTQPPAQGVPGLAPEVKQPGQSTDHPLPPSAEVNKRLEVYLYPPLRAFMKLTCTFNQLEIYVCPKLNTSKSF